jgi:hypothetical protein
VRWWQINQKALQMKYVVGALALTYMILSIMLLLYNNGSLAIFLLRFSLALGIFSIILMFPQQITMLFAGILLVNRLTTFMFGLGVRTFQIALGMALGAMSCVFTANLLR